MENRPIRSDFSSGNTRPEPRRAGFTFIELVVVISIIVALAAIGFPIWSMVKHRVDNSATETLVNSIATAITTYQSKTWTWNVGTTAAPQMRTYHMFDLNHSDSSGLKIPDLPDIPNGSPRFWSIDGYTAPEKLPYYNESTRLWADNIAPGDTFDGNFSNKVLDSGYRGFIAMAQPSMNKKFINKRGQVVDAWGRPLRISFAAQVYGTQAFGIWSAGLDAKDDLGTTRPSTDDLKSWETKGGN